MLTIFVQKQTSFLVMPALEKGIGSVERKARICLAIVPLAPLDGPRPRIYIRPRMRAR